MNERERASERACVRERYTNREREPEREGVRERERGGGSEREGEGRREREREIKNDESDSRAGLSCGKRIELHSTIHRQLSLQEGDAYSNFLLVQRTELAVFQGNKVHIDTIEAAPARVADHAVVADSVTAPFG